MLFPDPQLLPVIHKVTFFFLKKEGPILISGHFCVVKL